jgi:tetratricopeptide (TPR) repeat protein
LAAWRFGRAGFWFLAGLVLLLPSSSIFPAADLAADRRMYFPMIAFSACLALLLPKRPLVLIPILVALLILSFQRTQIWRTEESLWTDAVEKAPNKIRPRIQLARALPPDRGIQLLEQTKTIAPNDPRVASEQGRLYLRVGDPNQALIEFGRALALDPSNAAALNNRGAALLAMGQTQAAIEDFQRALARDPCQVDARHNLLHLGIVTTPPPATCPQ